MKFDEFNNLNDKEWLRLIWIKQDIFNKILDILQIAEIEKFKKGVKANKLSLENRLLMTLSYWREYRTYFHLGKNFGISEANCYRNIKWIKDILDFLRYRVIFAQKVIEVFKNAYFKV